jgi:hypothetical protein
MDQNHPGQTMTIYDLPGIINTYLHLAAIPANMKAEVKGTGIFSYNRYVFPEEEFLPSYITDRPVPPTNTAASNEKGMPFDGSTQSGSSNNHCPEPCRTSGLPLTPEDIRPFPKAAARNGALNKTKKRTTAILTDPPAKEALREMENSKQVNKNQILRGAKGASLTSLRKNQNIKWIQSRKDSLIM